MAFQQCPASPLVRGEHQPCMFIGDLNCQTDQVLFRCCWCGKTPQKWHYDDLCDMSDVGDDRSAGVILLLVGLVCGLGIGLVLAWAVMS